MREEVWERSVKIGARDERAFKRVEESECERRSFE